MAITVHCDVCRREMAVPMRGWVFVNGEKTLCLTCSDLYDFYNEAKKTARHYDVLLDVLDERSVLHSLTIDAQMMNKNLVNSLGQLFVGLDE